MVLTWSPCVFLYPLAGNKSPGNHSSRWLPKSNLLGWNLTLTDSLGAAIESWTRNQEIHQPLHIENSWPPSETEHHGKPALLRGKLVSRGWGWRGRSLSVEGGRGGPGIRESLLIVLDCPPTAASLCLARLRVPHQSITSFCLPSFQKASENTAKPADCGGARAGPEWWIGMGSLVFLSFPFFPGG